MGTCMIEQEASTTLSPHKLGAVAIMSTVGVVMDVAASAIGEIVVTSITPSVLLDGALQLRLFEAPAAGVFRRGQRREMCPDPLQL
jgi:hypothetical protein